MWWRVSGSEVRRKRVKNHITNPLFFNFFHPRVLFSIKMNLNTTQLLWTYIYRNEWLQFRQGKVFSFIHQVSPSHSDLFLRILWTILLEIFKKKEKKIQLFCPLFESRATGSSKSQLSYVSFSSFLLPSRSSAIDQLWMSLCGLNARIMINGQWIN